MDNTKIHAETRTNRICRVCGSELLLRSRMLTGIYEPQTEVASLEYYTVMECPKRVGLIGIVFCYHDKRMFTDDGAEVVLDEGQIAISVGNETVRQ